MKKITMMKLVKAVSLVAVGFSLMGNQGCEEKPVAEGPRLPKWYAEAGRVQSPVIHIGDQTFDFAYVASEQLNGVLFNSKGFTASYNGPGVMEGSQGAELGGAQKMYKTMFGTTAIGSELFFSDEARCLISIPDIKVTGSVLAYEMVSGSGITFGFNQSQVHSGVGIGGTFKTKVKDLALQIYGFDSAKDISNGKQKLIGAPLVHEKSKDTEGNISVDYNQIGLGYSWYKNTPLATITERALTTGVNILKDEMNKVAWNTKVLDIKSFDNQDNPIEDEGVVIKGGADINLKKGDQVVFFEDKTMWKGEPCKSDYYGFFRLNNKPIAYGEIVYLDRNFSTVAITKRFDNRNIKPGWRVELLKRVEDVEAEAKAAAAAVKK